TREALNQLDALVPAWSFDEVTKPTVCSTLVNTPSLDSTNQTIATAANTTTQATSESRKLNFITDSGSIRWRLSRALLGAGPTRPAQAPPGCGRPGWLLGGAPPAAVPEPRGIATNLEGLDLGLVMLENEAEIFDATPRAPFAAVAIAAAAAS